MKVQRLAVRDFRILGGSAMDLTFPAGRIGIFGPNEVGKSSMLEAIEVALYGVGAGRKAAGGERAELITWGRASTDLLLEFSSGLLRYRIHRRIGSRHEATLYQRVDEEDRLISSSVQEIQETVPSIIGMDRDAFEKLVYVRQQDLDALRQVAKSDREAMMNKVMGMEVFDEAIHAAKTELRARDSERQMADTELSAVQQDWRLYQEREVEQQKEQVRLEEISSRMAAAQKREKGVQRTVATFEWLKEQKNLVELRAQISEQLGEVSSQLEDLQARSKQLADLKVELDNLGNPELVEASVRRRASADSLLRKREEDLRVAHERLDRTVSGVTKLQEQLPLAQTVAKLFELRLSLRAKALQIEKQKAMLNSLEKETAAEENKAGLKTSDAQMVRSGLSAKKRRLLLVFASTLLAGLATLFVGLFSSPWVAVMGAALLIAAGSAFAGFFRLEKLAGRAVGLVALAEQRKSVEKNLRLDEDALRKETVREGFGALDQLEKAAEGALLQFRDSTGIERVEAFADSLRQMQREHQAQSEELTRLMTGADGLKSQIRAEDAVYPVPVETDLERLVEATQKKVAEKQTVEAEVKALESSIRGLTAKDLPSKSDSVRKRLKRIESDLAKHTDRRPEEADKFVYSEEEHREATANLHKAQTEVKDVSGELHATKEGLRRIDEDLKRTKPGFERYPGLKKRVEGLSEEVRVLERVTDEIRSTGAELRAKVLPAARYILNQLLPVITDGRYTDLEISEDFQFRAYSPEAGGFKKRDVFSGGTQDQFLIALRLAFTKAILDSRVRADEYSLFLDECTASSDDVRKLGIFQILDSLKATFSQIFIVAHEDISHLVDHHLALERGADGYAVVRARSWVE